MATAHIMSSKEDIADTVIMPGDPNRAKYIAENYLTDVKEVNNVRNMTAYTGNYKNKRVTIFPSGMGIPSMGIYAHELFNFYGVETIIRIGTCGAYKANLNLMDIILVDQSYTNSNFSNYYSGNILDFARGNKELNNIIKEKAQQLNKKVHIGNVYCSDCFYSLVDKEAAIVKEKDCLAVEMESFALFHIAACANKKASVVLTVSDSLVTNERTSAAVREQGLDDMILLVLEAIV